MHGRRQRPDEVSTGFVFTALVLGLILMPFIKCGQAIGCVSEDFGEAKALVTDEEEERPRTSTTLGERKLHPSELNATFSQVARAGASRHTQLCLATDQAN